MNKINNIAKNTSYFTLALVLQKVISFFYFTLLANYLPPDQLGKFYFAISFATIFAIFIDIGLANVLVREVARLRQGYGGQARIHQGYGGQARIRQGFGGQARSDSDSEKNKADVSRLLGSVLAIKVPLALLSYLFVVVLVNLLGYPELTRCLVYLAGISMVLDSFTLTFYAVIRGHHTLKYESIGSVVFQLIVLGLGFWALVSGASLILVISAQVIAGIFGISWSFGWLKFKLGIKIRPVFSWPLVRPILVLAVPFGLFGIFQRLYTYFDTVLLSLMAGDYQVGLYQIAFKIIFALQFLPMAFIASLYPAFASYWQDYKRTESDRSELDDLPGADELRRGKPAYADELRRGRPAFASYYKNSKKQLPITLERALKYLLIISLPIAAGIITLADEIVSLFKPEYLDSVPALRIIMLGLVFIFINFPLGALLNACDKQKQNTLNMAVALVMSISLNLVLIPFYGVVGAAITVVATNALMSVLGFYYANKITKINYAKLLLILVKIIGSALLMSITVNYLANTINLFISIALAGILYFVILFLLRVYRIEDIKSIIGSFMKNQSQSA